MFKYLVIALYICVLVGSLPTRPRPDEEQKPNDLLTGTPDELEGRLITELILSGLSQPLGLDYLTNPILRIAGIPSDIVYRFWTHLDRDRQCKLTNPKDNSVIALFGQDSTSPCTIDCQKKRKDFFWSCRCF